MIKRIKNHTELANKGTKEATNMQTAVGEAITATSKVLNTAPNTTIEIIKHIIKAGTTLAMASIIMGTVITTTTAIMTATVMID
ncbi:MAG TPA: hypothetical protein VIM85_08070 [Pseudomonadales bacterium]